MHDDFEPASFHIYFSTLPCLLVPIFFFAKYIKLYFSQLPCYYVLFCHALDFSFLRLLLYIYLVASWTLHTLILHLWFSLDGCRTYFRRIIRCDMAELYMVLYDRQISGACTYHTFGIVATNRTRDPLHGSVSHRCNSYSAWDNPKLLQWSSYCQQCQGWVKLVLITATVIRSSHTPRASSCQAKRNIITYANTEY